MEQLLNESYWGNTILQYLIAAAFFVPPPIRWRLSLLKPIWDGASSVSLTDFHPKVLKAKKILRLAKICCGQSDTNSERLRGFRFRIADSRLGIG